MAPWDRPCFSLVVHPYHHQRCMLLPQTMRKILLKKPYEYNVSISHLSTTSHVPNFFNYTSGRARRKRKRLLFLKNLEMASKDKADKEALVDGVDTRTVMDILFPNPFKGMEPPNQIKWPTTFAKWKEAFSLAWQDYKSSWVGFTTSKGLFVEDVEPEKEVQKEKIVGSIMSKSKEVMVNVKRNSKFLQTSAMKIRKEVRERTGITSIEDVKAYAADAMRLATECLNQFMQGYRKGRDEEVEKMLTQYFQNLEAQANQPRKKRRKPRRRVINRFHPMNR
jgi:hypothetical protein